MSSRKHRRLTNLAAGIVLLCAPCSAQQDGPSPYSEARFWISSDPTFEIIRIQSFDSHTPWKQRVIVYADGRAERTDFYRGKVQVTHEVHLELDHLNQIVREAVESGLAEWDAGRIHARIIQRHSRILRVPDGGGHVIRIHLDTYERDDFLRSPLKTEFEVESVRLIAEANPEIEQLQGALRLVRSVYGLFPSTKSQRGRQR